MVQRARRRQEIEIIKRIYFGFLPVPWILTAMLFVNGKFDAAPPQRETVSVVSKFEYARPTADATVGGQHRGGKASRSNEYWSAATTTTASSPGTKSSWRSSRA